MHRYHPDPNVYPKDAEAFILYDDCQRCDQHAADPRGLDGSNLSRAWERMLSDRWVGSDNDREVFKQLYSVHVLSERLGLK